MSLDSHRAEIVAEQAMYWVCRSDESRMTLNERTRFFHWLKRSPENISAILWIVRLDGRLKQRKLRDCADVLETSNVIEADFGAGSGRHDYQPREHVSAEVPRKNEVGEKPSWKNGWMWGMAAALTALTLAVLFAFFGLNRTPDGVVETRAAQWQKMTLDDGSIAYLDARTRIKVEFTAERRIVRLYHGAAVFEVMKDSRRPFVVSTDDVDITAVGTRFGVVIDNGVTTTVSEGMVEVAPRDGPAGSSVRLHKGQQLHVRPARASILSVADIAEVDATRELSWVTGRLEMRDTTVREIVRQFNRRHKVQAEIEDAELADQKIDLALMQVDSVKDFIEVMESRGVTVIIEGSRLILRTTPAK
ncbi:MAG TPA: FecR domain-containing protein [Steroidobacter sp.]|uniref:FecR family protein n=1 Tax=Steroidobacter sp. TaxID=1978227 RepID=UPI002EDB6720